MIGKKVLTLACHRSKVGQWLLRALDCAFWIDLSKLVNRSERNEALILMGEGRQRVGVREKGRYGPLLFKSSLCSVCYHLSAGYWVSCRWPQMPWHWGPRPLLSLSFFPSLSLLLFLACSSSCDSVWGKGIVVSLMSWGFSYFDKKIRVQGKEYYFCFSGFIPFYWFDPSVEHIMFVLDQL